MYSNFAGAGAGGVSVSSEQLAGVRGMGTGSLRGPGGGVQGAGAACAQ